MPTLAELPAGCRATVAAIRGTDAISQRLMEMGVFEGDIIEVVGSAPFGDPIEIRVGQTLLSLRLCEASRVEIHVKSRT